jgi:hypothetical protein
MALSLNQVVQRIRTLALAHHQINSFYFGDPHEFDANGEINYPGCFCELLTGTISRTDHQKRLNFRIHVLDLVPESTDSEGNETEVLSDTDQIVTDLLAMLMYSEYEADWMVEPVALNAPVTEAINDLCAGHFIEVGILVDFLADRCQVPADDVTFEPDFDMARTRLLTYEGLGTEGSSFTPASLAGKTVLAAYRAGFYKRIITTVPTDTERIGIVGTDLGERKGIFSSSGVVNLSAGDALVQGEILDFLIFE